MTINQLGNTELNRLLNEEVDPILKRMINRRSVERQAFKVRTRPVSGQYFLSKAITGGNFRLSGRAEDGIMPGQDGTAAYQDRVSRLSTQQTKYKRRYIYTTTDVTGPMRNAPKTESGGFENIAGLVLKDTVDNLPESFSRKMAVGQAGVLGRVLSKTDNVITLEPANAAATAAAAYPYAGNRYFREGMVCDFISGSTITNALRLNSGGVQKNRYRLLDSMSDDGTTCTLTFNDLGTDAVDNTIAAGDLIIEAGTRQEGAIDTQAEFLDGFYDPLGIPDAVQDGSDGLYSMSYMGDLQVSANKTMQAIKLANSTTTSLTKPMIDRLVEKIAYDPIAGGNPSMTYCTPSVYRQFALPFNTTSSFAGTSSTNVRSGLAAENPIRYQEPGAGPLSVGVKGIVVNTFNTGDGTRTFLTSPFAPHYRLFLIAKEELELLQDREPGFMDDDGLTLRQTPTKDAFNIIWKAYMTGITNKHPRKSAYITGLLGDHNNT